MQYGICYHLWSKSPYRLLVPFPQVESSLPTVFGTDHFMGLLAVVHRVTSRIVFTGPCLLTVIAGATILIACVVKSGPRFTNGFSIAIQIRWKFRFTLISILIQWSLQNFVHGTTAVLSWHVQKFVAIWWSATELQQGEVSIEFELRAKNR